VLSARAGRFPFFAHCKARSAKCQSYDITAWTRHDGVQFLFSESRFDEEIEAFSLQKVALCSFFAVFL
jgi:hypothetical protein